MTGNLTECLGVVEQQFNYRTKNVIREIMNEFEKAIIKEMREVRKALSLPAFMNRSKISNIWGYRNQSSLKLWQIPDFGIPEYFNGKCPMYSADKVYEIVANPKVYKEFWERKTVKEKQEIRSKFLKLKQQEVILCH